MARELICMLLAVFCTVSIVRLFESIPDDKGDDEDADL